MSKGTKEEKQDLVTFARYGELAGISRQAVSARVKAGTLKAVAVGGVPFIDLNEFPVSKYGKVARGRRKKTD